MLSRVALLPPLHRSVRFDQILLDRCLESATHIRSHHCFNIDTLTWCLPLHTSPCGTPSRACLAMSNEMARPLLCRSDESLQSLVSLLHRQGLSVSFCIETLRDLSSDSSNTFADRPHSLSWTTRSLHPCPCFCHSRLCPCLCSADAHRSTLAQVCCQCTVVFS